MNLAQARAGVLVLLTTLLQSCGGGGGGDGGNNGGGNDSGRLSVSTTSISISAEPGEAAQKLDINATIQNPADNLWAYVSSSNNGIQDAWFEWTSSSTAVVHLHFKVPHEIENDRYEDDIQFYVCPDSACNENIAGSPARIHAVYDIEGGTSATLSTNHVESGVDGRSEDNYQEIVRLDLERPIEYAGYYEVTHSSRAIGSVSAWPVSDMQRDIYINYKRGVDIPQGTHEDLVKIKVCYTSDCTKELEGSPLRITSTHEVTIHPEPGFEDLPVASRVALGHDVIDAEFSRTLNRIVMVSRAPENALYVYDVATGVEQQQLLVSAPNSVSVGPDGTMAAVGHDRRISIIDVADVGQVGAPAPTLLDVTTNVGDIVLDGHGRVHAFPLDEDPTVVPHSVEISTNTERLGTGQLVRGARARLHPSGDAIYEARALYTPDNIAKWDISTGVATRLYESAYHGNYNFCGNLWYDDSGDRIFTACSHIFSASAVAADDLQYLGAMQLTDGAPSLYSFLIRRLSHDPADNEIALIETTHGCESYATNLCYSHLATYDGDSLTRKNVYAIQPMTVDSVVYSQIGHHLFHDATNSRKYLVSRLEGMADQAAAFYLSVVE